jgi:hypothetical protein
LTLALRGRKSRQVAQTLTAMTVDPEAKRPRRRNVPSGDSARILGTPQQGLHYVQFLFLFPVPVSKLNFSVSHSVFGRYPSDSANGIKTKNDAGVQNFQS